MIGMIADSNKHELKLPLIGHLLKAAHFAEQLHMQIEGGNGRTFAQTLRQVIRQLMPKPNYDGQCCRHGNNCIYLGEFRDRDVNLLYDLYWCSWSNLAVARYGDSIFDYMSGYGSKSAALVEAERRIKLAGLK